MTLISVLTIFCAVLKFQIVTTSGNCEWTDCIPDRSNNSLTPSELHCPNEGEAVSIKPCLAEGGYMAYCCHQNGTEVQKGTSSNFMWWPNENGILVRVSTFCPFPTHIATDESVKFYLYTRNNTDMMDFNEIFVDDIESLESSGFLKDAPVKMVIHGFMSHAHQGPSKAMRKGYVKLPYPVNMIGVDWRRLANYAEGPNMLNPFNYLCYGAAAEGTPFVGKRCALLLEFLIKQNYTQLENIHVMGHSLGAHCAGHTGKSFSMGKFLRITGFDPAGPHFRNVDASKRIDYTDAEFVDIIHTSTTGGDMSFGLREAVGHADFYPNTGISQPGCSRFPPYLVPPFPPRVSCSHGRSYDFYGESIKPPSNKVFRGILCKSVEEAESGKCEGPENSLMGACATVNNSSRKIYYLKTNAESPYALDEEKDGDPNTCSLN